MSTCNNMESNVVSSIIAEVVKESAHAERRTAPSSSIRQYFDASRSLSRKLSILNERSCDEKELTLSLFRERTKEMTSIPTVGLPINQRNRGNLHNSSFSNEFIIGNEEEIKWEWEPSENQATFSTRGQIRRGSTHGKGGRLPGSGAQIRRNYLTYARTVLYRRLQDILRTVDESRKVEKTDEMSQRAASDRAQFVTQKMLEDLSQETEITGLKTDRSTSVQVRNNLLRELQQFAEQKVPSSIEHLPCGILGVSARFTKSDFVEPKVVRSFNVRERHVITTWVDRKGGVRCTCIGSTQYDMYALNGEFCSSCCIHAQAVTEILQELCKSMFGTSSVHIRVIYSGFAALYAETVESINRPLPIFRSLHGGKTILYIGEDTSQENQLCWIPIRMVQRGGVRSLCAFCDLVDPNKCFHVSAFRRFCGEDLVDQTNSNSCETNEEGFHVGDPDPFILSNELNQSSIKKNHQPISTLPISPVSCPLAMRVDQEVCDLLKANCVFSLKAPMFCTICKCTRIENSREVNSSGVIMCSLGACAMEVETYLCSGCNIRFSAEGRKEGVFVDSVCMAASHKLLRDQLIGFTLGNGTLSSRLSQFHSQVTAFEDAGIFKSSLSSRSTRKLYDLCISFLRLMVCKPPVSLFTCDTCQITTITKGKDTDGLRAVCVDGIWAGYQKKTVIPFQNVSQPCTPLKSFSRSAKSCFRNPQTSFFRLEKTVTFLISAIKGRAIEATHSSIFALLAAARVTSDTALPANFYSSSICGTFQTDYRNDIGDGYLKSLRELTSSLFHRQTILYRLLEPLQKLFQRQGKRRKTSKASKKKCDENEAYRIVTLSISQISSLAHTEEGVAWNDALESIANEADFGTKILRLYTAMLQGPLTHLIRRDEIPSATIVAKACIYYKPNEFMKAMVKKSFVPNSGSTTETDTPDGSNILMNLRIISAGLFCASVLDKKLLDAGENKPVLPIFGHLLLSAVQVLEGFYSFYDDHVSNGGTTAAKYARDWQSRSFNELREKFIKFSTSEPFQPSWGNDYNDPFVTGAYFPSLPQVRPLPFNDQKEKVADVESYGICSKHYLQRNASFTPGALTFSCSCSHPKVLGFKVLERDEGPRAVLDVLVSRFASLPPFVIYDFACGVYRSAVGGLWWVVESSTLVSDPFHANNHTCSPAFVPSAHVKLNMLNKISHEQRNRPIARIKNSLQQTGQDVYIALLAYQITINNIEAKGQRAEEVQVPVRNRSAKDIEWAFFHRLGMSCYCCTKAENSST